MTPRRAERFHVSTPLEELWVDAYEDFGPALDRYMATPGARIDFVRVRRMLDEPRHPPRRDQERD